jgi:hypothetical protein
VGSNQSKHWSVPCSSSPAPSWEPGWVHTVTLGLKSTHGDDTVWTPTPFCLLIHLLINKVVQAPDRSIGSGTDLNGSSWRSTCSFWLPESGRGFRITRDHFGWQFRNKRTEDRPTSANKKFW